MGAVLYLFWDGFSQVSAPVLSDNRYSVAASGFVVPGATAAGTFEPVAAGNRSAQ